MSYKKEQWFKIISEYKESDCTPKEFYEKRNLSKSSFYRHLKEFERHHHGKIKLQLGDLNLEFYAGVDDEILQRIIRMHASK